MTCPANIHYDVSFYAKLNMFNIHDSGAKRSKNCAKTP